MPIIGMGALVVTDRRLRLPTRRRVLLSVSSDRPALSPALCVPNLYERPLRRPDSARREPARGRSVRSATILVLSDATLGPF